MAHSEKFRGELPSQGLAPMERVVPLVVCPMFEKQQDHLGVVVYPQVGFSTAMETGC